jgi:GNAT superfamily N-acetyltransferase
MKLPGRGCMLLRSAQPNDALAVARVHVRSWQVGYRGLLPDDYLDRLLPEERARRYTFGGLDEPATIVATQAGAIYGFATTAPSRDPGTRNQGELCALYVDPDWWDRGVGSALESAARAQLMQRGFANAVLWILEGNSRAARFYRTHGWMPDDMRRTDAVWGVTVNEVRYWRSL